MLENIFYYVTVFLWPFILFNLSYTIVLAIAGLRTQKPILKHKPGKRFACLIPAHNEVNVIGELIRSLKDQDYPSSKFDIYVVADHCEDDTGKIAELDGAKVYNRNFGSRGKGSVLRFFLDKLFSELPEDYDAVCIFDADNVVHRNFLQRMNDALFEGRQCIQGYLGTKNPDDNWVTKAIFSSYLLTNRLWQLGNENLGLPVACGGTGICITTAVLKRFGWPAQSLTEDLEMQMVYSLNGLRFSWMHDAITYDEKPSSIRVAIRQRVRWTIGHISIQRKYVFKLLKNAMKRRDFRLFDQAVYLMSPMYWFAFGILLVGFLSQLFTGVPMFRLGTPEALILDFFSLFAYPALGIYLETKSIKAVHMIPYLLAFTPIWFISTVLALKSLNRKDWYHTPHGATKKCSH